MKTLGELLSALVSLTGVYPMIAADIQALVEACKRKGALTPEELDALIKERMDDLANNPALQPDQTKPPE